MNHTARNLTYALAGIAVTALPCLPLLDLHKVFNADWPNQIWLINWVASYFAEHHQFPASINSDRLVGMVYPIFYGHLFFPLIGALSVAWNAEITVRLAAFAIYNAQFFLLTRLGNLIRLSRLSSFFLATIVTWSIYPMTNLYNRGALPEFFATMLLSCASCVWLFVLEAHEQRKQFILANLFVFLFTLSAGSHPITALYGACFLSGLMVVSIMIRKPNLRNLLVSLLVPGLLTITVLAPWVMATTRYSRQFVLAVTFKHVAYYSRSLDSLYERLMPFPLETKSYKHKLQDDHAVGKHLDMQINMPLFLLLLVCLFTVVRSKNLRDRKSLIAVIICTVFAFLLIWLSLQKGSLDKLGHNFRTIQFAYRLITYVNLSTLFGIVFCFWRQPFGARIVSDKRLMLSLLLVSFVGLAFKLVHVQEAAETAKFELARTRTFTMSLNKMPDTFYGWDAYSVINAFPDLTPVQLQMIHNCPFTPSTNKFGEVDAVTTPVGYIQTNIEQFPWNYIVEDASSLPLPRLENEHLIALNMPQNTVVRFQIIPASIYVTARLIAYSVFALWLMLTLISCTIGTRRLVTTMDED